VSDRRFKLYLFKSTFDNVVDERCAADFTWPELAEVFTQHEVVETKENVSLFIGGHFTTAGAETTAEGQVRRVSANLRDTPWLVLDYDGTATMEHVFTALQGVQHVAYTSHSHRKGSVDRFRVVVPFKDDCPRDEWLTRRDSILSCVPAVDSSTVAWCRAFYLPSCPPSREADKFAWSMNGEVLDWRDFEREEPLPPAPPPVLIDTGERHSEAETMIRLPGNRCLSAAALYDVLPPAETPDEGYRHRAKCFRLDGADSTPSCFIYRLNHGLFYKDNNGPSRFIRVRKVSSVLTLQLGSRASSHQ
jgi:hypothetical protein